MIKPLQHKSHNHTSAVLIVFLACLLFCSSLRSLFAVDVEINKFYTISTNVSTDIVVFLDPLTVMEEVCLNLRTIKGTGEAIFIPGGHRATNILQTSILRIAGNQLSNIESNMVLEATVKGRVIASNIFSVVNINMITTRKEITNMPTAIQSNGKTKKTIMTKSKAIEIAKEAIKGRKIQEGAPITVELKGKDYIVTFGYIRPSPKEQPGWRGPDFKFKVTLDAYTGSLKNGIQRSE